MVIRMITETIDLHITDIREPEVVANCECGAEIYEGEDVIAYQGDWYCSEQCYHDVLIQDNPPVRQIISREDL